MIVCSCAIIDDRAIRGAARAIRRAEPRAVVTPGRVYRALGKRPNCGVCAPRFAAVLGAALADEHRSEEAAAVAIIAEGETR